MVKSSIMRAQRDPAGVDEGFERDGEGGFEADDAEGALLELLHLLAAGVGRVVGGDGIDDAGDDAVDQRGGVAARRAAAASSCSCCRRAACRNRSARSGAA